MLSAQRAVRLRLRVTTHVTLVASDAATTMAPAISISVWRSGSPIHANASRKLSRLTVSSAAMDGGWK